MFPGNVECRNGGRDEENVEARIPLLMRPYEEEWMRHQENFGEAHLNAADGVVAHKSRFCVSDHPGRCRGHPSSRGGESSSHQQLP